MGVPWKRGVLGLTFVVGCVGVAVTCVAMGTQHWVEAGARHRLLPSNSSRTSGDGNRYLGKVHFGLFAGHKELNPGFGQRAKSIYVACLARESVCVWSEEEERAERLKKTRKEYTMHVGNQTETNSTTILPNGEAGFMNFKLWVTTLIFLVLAIAFGLVGVGFSAFNTAVTPVQCLTGLDGLYLWYGAAGISNVHSLILWMVMYYTELRKNVMNPEDLRLGWTSKGEASFGYSFWLVLGSAILFGCNCGLVFISTHRNIHRKQTKIILNEKPADGIMLY